MLARVLRTNSRCRHLWQGSAGAGGDTAGGASAFGFGFGFYQDQSAGQGTPLFLLGAEGGLAVAHPLFPDCEGGQTK